ncbi:MAG: ATP-binding protein, partial [Pyrobaculum sp.]
MKRITLKLAPGVKMEFTDRDRALAQVVEWAERGTRFPVVIFGPEGCGKTAFLRQAAAMLRELGYDAIYIDAAHLHFIAHTDVADVVRRLVEAAAETSGVAQLKLANLAIDIVKELLDRWGR